MDKSFDDLFNEFFKKNNINPEDKLNSRDKERAKILIDLLSKLNKTSDIGSEDEKEIDASLGKPDKIEFYNEDDNFFEKRIWYTDEGQIEKLVFSKDPTLVMPKANIIETLKKKLDDAVENEEFEKAASIRDEIIKLEKPKRKRIKKEK